MSRQSIEILFALRAEPSGRIFIEQSLSDFLTAPDARPELFVLKADQCGVQLVQSGIALERKKRRQLVIGDLAAAKRTARPLEMVNRFEMFEDGGEDNQSHSTCASLHDCLPACARAFEYGVAEVKEPHTQSTILREKVNTFLTFS